MSEQPAAAAPAGRPVLDGKGLRVAVVAAREHPTATDGLLIGAQRALAACRVEDVWVLRVPGAFELPVVAKALAQQRFDALVALGVVVRQPALDAGPVCRATVDGLQRVSVDGGIPVGFGLLACDSEEEAVARSGLPGSTDDTGRRAVESAVETALLLRQIRRGEATGGSGGKDRR